MLITKLNRFAINEAFQPIIFPLHYKLDRNHERATDLLMLRAEESGLDSSLIWTAAKYCRELLADPQCTYRSFQKFCDSQLANTSAMQHRKNIPWSRDVSVAIAVSLSLVMVNNSVFVRA